MPIPDAPIPTPPKATVAPARPKGEAAAEHDPADLGHESEPRQAKSLPWGPIFGVLCAVLLLLTFIFWGKVGIRDRSIAATKNRVEQVEAGGLVMKAELDEARAVTGRVQQQLDETKTEATQLRTALATAKTDATEMQAQLDKTRTTSAGYQTQLAEAKVASIKQEGEATKAVAQTSMTQTELTKTKEDLTALGTKLAEAKTQSEETQKSLDGARIEISRLQKLAAKK